MLIFGGICIIGASAQSSPSEVLDPLVADPHHYHLELQNSWVRVIREQMGPRESTAWHRHPQPGAVIVLLTDQHIRQTLQDGTTRVIRRSAGTTFSSPGSTHKGENLDDAPFEYVAVEPKVFGSGVVACGHERFPAIPFRIGEISIVGSTVFHVDRLRDYLFKGALRLALSGGVTIRISI
jgi:hypothetical protein